jgi:peptidoglycan hydrolase-like protein with peptidoglycan-binding domain
MLARPRDSALAIVAAAAALAILVNSLFLQTGPHPAPIFALRPLPVVSDEPTGAVAPVPRARPPEVQQAQVQTAPSQARPRNEITADVQRELNRRGYYDAAVDGVFGAKTDAAIRDFEQSNGMKSTGEPTEALLQAILRAPTKQRATQQPQGSAPARRDHDQIAGLLEPAQRMSAIQRALSEFGYGPVAVTGVYSPETRAAIERFERTHNLPITGEISDRVARELTAMTGRPL